MTAKKLYGETYSFITPKIPITNNIANAKRTQIDRTLVSRIVRRRPQMAITSHN